MLRRSLVQKKILFLRKDRRLRRVQANVIRGSILLVNSISPTIYRDVLLTKLDFPDYFVNMAHPLDYKVTDNIIKPDLFENTVPHHHRILFRISVQLKDKYAPCTFILDTGASAAIYLGARAMTVLDNADRLHEDDLGNVYMTTPIGRAAVLETPYTHQPANIIGLDLLKKLKLQVGMPPTLGVNLPYL